MNTTNTQEPHKAKLNLKNVHTNRGYHGAESDEVGFPALAAAIVKQAVDDYRYADEYMKGYHVTKSASWANRYAHSAAHTKDEVIKFFLGQWYALLCDIDPERIIKHLQTGA